MRSARVSAACLCTVTATAFLGAAALAAIPVRIIARAGDPAPGFPTGTSYSSVISSAPRLTPGGLILYNATVANPADEGIFLGAPTAPALLVRHSDPEFAAQAPFWPVGARKFANDAGDVVFESQLNSASRLYGWRAGVRTLLAAQGLPTPTGGTWTFVSPPHALNNAGQTLFVGKRTGQFRNSNWVMDVTGASYWDDSVFLGQVVAPPAPHVWEFFGEGRGLNAAGRFAADATFTFAFDWRHGVVALGPSGPAMFLSDQDPPPGLPGLSIQNGGLGGARGISTVSPLNSAGQRFFVVGLAGPGVNTANDGCLYFFDGQAFSIVLREGDPAVGVGPDLTWVGPTTSVTLNAHGDFASRVRLSGPGVTIANEEALVVGGPSSPRAVLREGDQAPSLPPGFYLESIVATSINERGLVVVAATAKSGIVRRVVFYAIDPGASAPRKIIADGDAVITHLGQTGTLGSTYLPDSSSGNDDGLAGWLSDAGDIVFVGFVAAGQSSILLVNANPCAADINGDAVVDFLDLNIVLGQYGQTGISLEADINHDGVVNFLDLNILLGEFGRNC